VNIRQAPRFHSFFTRVEGRQVMLMLRLDWECHNQLREGDIAMIDLSITPIVGVTHCTRIEAAVARRESDAEIVVKVYRNDPKDVPTPINVDCYRVWERLPRHRNFFDMVKLASTEDNPNMRGFLEDHVFFLKEDVPWGEHRLPELPAQVRELLTRKT
jgi:hypothetical protein